MPPIQDFATFEAETTALLAPPASADAAASAPSGARPNREKAAPVALPIKHLAQFLAEYEPIHYRVEPVLRSSSLYTLTAPTGAGKTALQTVLALAVSTGCDDLLAMPVEQARVLYCAFENPDDVRMRFITAASWLGIDMIALGAGIDIIDVRGKPEQIAETIRQTGGEYGVVIVDTLQAAFDGADANDNVATGEFMRRLRPLAQLPGRPSILVAAHPVKGASENNLIPYGGGAILNEIDGNLTLSKSKATGIVALHHQGKFRGLEFAPKLFRFELAHCPNMKDAKGRIVELPILRPTTEDEVERREVAAVSKDVALLRAIIETPNASYQNWTDMIGLKSKGSLAKRLEKLEKAKLVTKSLDRYTVTATGKKAIEARSIEPAAILSEGLDD